MYASSSVQTLSVLHSFQKEISVPYNEDKGEYEKCKMYDVDWWAYDETELLNHSKSP